MRIKRLVALAILVIILTGLILFGLSDTVISIADTSVPDSKVAAKANKAYDSDSASATITMYALPDE